MRKSYEIDYHARNIRRQLSQIILNEYVVDILDITIRFVTGMLAFDTDYCKDVSTVLFYDDNNLELIFLFSSSSYDHFIEKACSEKGIRKFFEHYYDEISQEYSQAENKLSFRLTLLPENEMKEKYLKALDK
jgi:hypothetical protein